MAIIQSRACRYGAHRACQHVTCRCPHHIGAARKRVLWLKQVGK